MLGLGLGDSAIGLLALVIRCCCVNMLTVAGIGLVVDSQIGFASQTTETTSSCRKATRQSLHPKMRIRIEAVTDVQSPDPAPTLYKNKAGAVVRRTLHHMSLVLQTARAAFFMNADCPNILRLQTCQFSIQPALSIFLTVLASKSPPKMLCFACDFIGSGKARLPVPAIVLP